jgi:hypothetical protein
MEDRKAHAQALARCRELCLTDPYCVDIFTHAGERVPIVEATIKEEKDNATP